MKDQLFDLYGYTWDEAPKHLKECALHLSDALKIEKYEAYITLVNRCIDLSKKEVEEWRKKNGKTI